MDATNPDLSARPLPRSAVWMLASAHGLIFALAFPPFDLWPLALLAPLPLALIARSAATTRQALLATLLTQWLLWLWMLRWIIPVTLPGYPLLAMYMSVYPAGFVWLVRAAGCTAPFRALPSTIVVPLLWTAVEFARGDVILGGYPWYLLAHATIEWLPFVQSADLLGQYFVSFIAAMPAGLIADLLAGRQARQVGAAARAARPIRCAVATVAVVGANVGYGVWRLGQQETLSPGPVILAVQTNLPQSNKIGWSIEQRAVDVPHFIDLTRSAFAEAARQTHVDLIVWPETMVPGLGFEPHTRATLARFGGTFQHLLIWPDAVEALARQLNTPMLVGSPAWIGAAATLHDDDVVQITRGHEYNSAYLVQARPPFQRYDKVVLTPFGETMPLISKWPWLESKLLSLGAPGMSFELDAAPELRVLELPWTQAPAGSGAGQGLLTIGTPICFEDTVARLTRRMIYQAGHKRGQMLVNLSNDGWFNGSDADRRLHARIARLRCIENRVPMVRAVNTGMSIAVDSAGRIVGKIGPARYGEAQREGSLLVQVTLDSRHAPYARLADVWPWGCLGAAIVLIAGRCWWARRTGVRPMTHWKPTTLALAALCGSAVAWGCAPSGQAPQPWSTKGQASVVRDPDMPGPHYDMGTVERAPTAVSAQSLREPALRLLLQAAQSSNPLLRTNAIEALQSEPHHLQPVLQRALGDENRAVRFAAAMSVGKLKLVDLAPLVEPLVHDESGSVQAAAIYALRRTGRKPNMNPLAQMLLGDDAEVKANAAFVFGELGDRSAVQVLRSAAGRGLARAATARRRMAELQLAEAMVKLGAVQHLDAIRAALFSPAEEGELAALACQMCGELRDGGALPNLLDFAVRTGRRQQSAEVRLAAVMAIAQIDPSRVPLAVAIEYSGSDRFELRAQAAHTLGAIAEHAGHPQALAQLARLVEDPNPLVQVAAAGAILRSQALW